MIISKTLQAAVIALGLGLVVGVSAGDPRQLVNQGQAAYNGLPNVNSGQAASREGNSGKIQYRGHQVIRVDWRRVGRHVREELMDLVETMGLDVWKATPKAIDIRLPSYHLPILETYLHASMSYTTLIPDLQHLIDETAPLTTASPVENWHSGRDRSNMTNPFHDNYHSLDEIYAFGDSLVEEYGDVMESFHVGVSAEGRTIIGYRVHDGRVAEREVELKRKGRKGDKGVDEGVLDHRNLEFVVQSGQHAREWIGPSTAMYFLHHILTSSRENPRGDMAEYLKLFTFTIIPTINPDGFVYSHEHERLWRKNRQDVGHPNPTCVGVDLNSNWGYKWRFPKSGACSDTYAGREAFDAPETKAVSQYLIDGSMGNRGDGVRHIRAFVDLHSYGQLFMFPFAVSCDDFPPDAENLLEAGEGVAKAMRQRRGEEYEIGQACDLTYRAPGDAIDYTYGTRDIRWSWSAELRDTGTYGFMLPRQMIRVSAEEIADGLTFLAKFIYNMEMGN